MTRKLLIIATADARGHLMRTQLLYHLMRKQGAEVDVLTTSLAGIDFLAEFNVPAQLLSTEYYVVFDAHQNMLKSETDARISRYVFSFKHMGKDLLVLRKKLRQYDLVLNDSFHPALLLMAFLQMWRKNIVQIFGQSLQVALQNNFAGRAHPWLSKFFSANIALALRASKACLVHDFAFSKHTTQGNRHFLPTPVAIPTLPNLQVKRNHFSVYLNPHFADEGIALAIENYVAEAEASAHLVGESFGQRQGWLAMDNHFVNAVCQSEILVSAPGMAALSMAYCYGIPIILIVTSQPEQTMNATRAQKLGLLHQVVVWQHDIARFTADLNRASSTLRQVNASHKPQSQLAQQRLQLWANTLNTLLDQ